MIIPFYQSSQISLFISFRLNDSLDYQFPIFIRAIFILLSNVELEQTFDWSDEGRGGDALRTLNEDIFIRV